MSIKFCITVFAFSLSSAQFSPSEPWKAYKFQELGLYLSLIISNDFSNPELIKVPPEDPLLKKSSSLTSFASVVCATKTISIFSKDLQHIIVISFNGMFYKINFSNNEYVSIIKESL